MLEKLKKELEKTKNPMEKALGEYILSLGREVKEGANLMGCAAKVKEKAKAQASGGCAIIEDSVVYGWAREYFGVAGEAPAPKAPEPAEQPKPEKDNAVFLDFSLEDLL